MKPIALLASASAASSSCLPRYSLASSSRESLFFASPCGPAIAPQPIITTANRQVRSCMARRYARAISGAKNRGDLPGAIEGPPMTALPGPATPTRTLTLSSRGETLHAEWFAPGGSPRGVAVMVHGYAEHIGRYREVA